MCVVVCLCVVFAQRPVVLRLCRHARAQQSRGAHAVPVVPRIRGLERVGGRREHGAREDAGQWAGLGDDGRTIGASQGRARGGWGGGVDGRGGTRGH